MLETADLLSVLEKTNQIAAQRDWLTLAERTLQFLADGLVCRAEAGLLYWPGLPDEQQPWWRQGEQSYDWPGLRAGLLRQNLFLNRNTQWLDQVALARNYPELAPWLPHITNLMVLPIQLDEQQECCPGIVLVNVREPRQALAEFVVRRMTSELDKAARLERERRLNALNKTHREQGASLDPERILRRLLDQARYFLQVEAVSLFLVDEVQGDNVLWMASQADHDTNVEKLRVPPGKGIIGHVIQSGQPMVVQDAYGDPRFYRQVDANSGFTTRSILTVPLVARSVDLGQERGVYSERIIGGLQAINKLNGRFQPEDTELLQELSNRAATEWIVARLFDDLRAHSRNLKVLFDKKNELFEDFIRALTEAIDARDKKNPGHSSRVSEYSVEIGRELGLSPEAMENLRVGSILHDIGKIGVDDAILNKPGRLDESEWEQMRKHPTTGKEIICGVRQMDLEIIQAISEHHEKLDGTGYPAGLKGEQISQIGRIVAVADVFDAITSKRPYRPVPMVVEEALDHINNEKGAHFDPVCVDALMRAFLKGNIKTQFMQELREKSEDAAESGANGEVSAPGASTLP